MKAKGIPFIAIKYDNEGAEVTKGIRTSLLNHLSGNSKGLNFGVVSNSFGGESKGLNLAGVLNWFGEECKGFSLAGISNISLNSKTVGHIIDYSGALFSLGANYISGKCKGLSVAGGINYAKASKKYLIQVSILGNHVKEVGPDDFVLQIGLYNKAENNTSPIINFKNFKKLQGIANRD